jgi:hypothetical protein
MLVLAAGINQQFLMKAYVEHKIITAHNQKLLPMSHFFKDHRLVAQVHGD